MQRSKRTLAAILIALGLAAAAAGAVAESGGPGAPVAAAPQLFYHG